MAKNIIVQVAGGSKQVMDDVYSVGEIKRRLGLTDGYTAALNGDTASDDTNLEEGDMVTLSKAVKGGQA